MIELKNDIAINLMVKAGEILRDTFAELEKHIKPGVTTKELDTIAENYILSRGATPTEKGYYGFPASICASVNEVIVHGIPSDNIILKEGDIISIDCVVCYNGYNADAARTYPVGKISPEKARLIKICEECFYEGIKQAVIGNRIGDISHAIQKHAEKFGYSVIRELSGHGIGKEMHEDPDVPNYGARGFGPVIKEGLAIAVEPMISMGSRNVVFEKDGWTCRMKDRKPSAHYENTIIVTNDGVKIITL